MAVAQKADKLRKEQQFVLGVAAKEVFADTDSDGQVLIQGIIDAYFFEEEDIILMDYKTDRVSKKDGEKILKDRYKTQLDLYEKAIERLTHKKVKERIIYSTYLEKEISV